MRLFIKNKLELMEMRFCYALAILSITLLLGYGFRQSILLLGIGFLPFMRTISLYSFLLNPTTIITKIIQSLLILFPILFYSYLVTMMNLWTLTINVVALYVLMAEILLLILFHRFIFLSKRIFMFDRIAYPVYRIFKNYCLDVVLILIAYKIVASSSIYEAFTNWIFSSFLSNYLVAIGRNYWFVYIYMAYIAIAGIWYLMNKKMKNKIEKK